jgi:hypothetical protein
MNFLYAKILFALNFKGVRRDFWRRIAKNFTMEFSINFKEKRRIKEFDGIFINEINLLQILNFNRNFFICKKFI